MSRAFSILAVAVSLTAALVGWRATPAPPAALASPVATPFICPVTEPNGAPHPDPQADGDAVPGGYGNEALWTNLWNWGEDGVFLPPGDGHIGADGSFNGLKWGWWRHVPGELVIEGRRLDASAPPLRAHIPDGYGDLGLQVTGITFPTIGCWEVTGRLGDASLTFVIRVDYAQSSATPHAKPLST